MMRDRVEGGRFWRRLAAFAVGLAVATLAAPLSAQQDWAPTVATSPGGTLNVPPVGAGQRVPPQIDPRFFPPPGTLTPVRPIRNPIPQGATSPLVTGALPQPNERRGPAPAGASRIAQGANAPPAAKEAPANVPAAPAGAAGKAKADEPAPAGGGEFFKPGPLTTLPPDATAAQQYCFNTADAAGDARFAWQAKKIQDMEAELDKRARQLEAKTEEYKKWLARRDEFSRKAQEQLVGFYSRMRPDAAAIQLAALDDDIAAALVTKFTTKVASQIMGEMDPERAAKIATIISGAAKVPKQAKRNPREAKPPGDSAEAPEGAAVPERPES